MIEISNKQYSDILRFLAYFHKNFTASTIREEEIVRMTALLLTKLKKRKT